MYFEAKYFLKPFYFKKPEIIWNNLRQVEGILCGNIYPKGKQGCCDFFSLLLWTLAGWTKVLSTPPLSLGSLKVTSYFPTQPSYRNTKLQNVFLVYRTNVSFAILSGVFDRFSKRCSCNTHNPNLFSGGAANYNTRILCYKDNFWGAPATHSYKDNWWQFCA